MGEVWFKVRAGCALSPRGDTPGEVLPGDAQAELSLKGCMRLTRGRGRGRVLQAEGLQGTRRAEGQSTAQGTWGGG